MVKAIFFDLWDTLIYLCGSHPVVEIKKKLGLTDMNIFQFSSILEKTIMTKKFKTVEDEFTELLEALKVEKTDSLLYSISEVWKKNVSNLYFPPIMDEMLREAKKGVKLALLTNTDSFPFEFVKLRYGIEKYFDCVITSYEIGSVKPETNIFDIACEKLGVKPEEVVMCGDNPFNDIIPAKGLGMKTILVDTKNIFSEFRGADYVVNNIKDFVDRVKAISYIEYQNKFVSQKA